MPHRSLERDFHLNFDVYFSQKFLLLSTKVAVALMEYYLDMEAVCELLLLFSKKNIIFKCVNTVVNWSP